MATSALRPVLDTSYSPRPILDTSGYGLTDVERAAADAASGNSLTNSFTGARLNSRANLLADEESQLRIDPRNALRANQLQNEREALKAQAQQYAAPVGRWEDIHGVGDAGSWFAGQVGQAAGSSLDQMATGVGMNALASGLQMIPHPVAQLAGTGLRLAAPVEMYRQNKNLLTGEGYDTVAADPTVMKTRSAQDIRDEVSKHGYRAAVMDTATQLLPVGQMTGTLGKTLAKIPTSAKFVGTQVGEGLTETGQEISQHFAHEALNPNRDTRGDASALQNSFLGGMAGGTGLSTAGLVGDKIMGAGRTPNSGAEPGQDVDLSGNPGKPGAPAAPGRITPMMTPDLDATLSGTVPTHLASDPIKMEEWLIDNLTSRAPAMTQHLESMAKDGDSRAAALLKKVIDSPPDSPEQDKVLNAAYQHISEQEAQIKASPKGQRRALASAFSVLAGKAGDGFIKGFEAAGNKLVDATQGKKNMQGFDTSGYDEWLKNKEEATGNARAKDLDHRANPDDYAQVDGSGPISKVARKQSMARAKHLTDRMQDEGLNTLDVIQRSRAELMGNTMMKATETHTATRVQMATHMATDEDGKNELMKIMGFEIADLAGSWGMTPSVGPKQEMNADKRITQFPGLKITLNNIVNSIKLNTGPNAQTVLQTLRSQADPAAAPLFDMMDAELAAQNAPDVKAHTARIHDEAKDALIAAIPIERRHALAKGGVNIESDEGRGALLTAVTAIVRGQANKEYRNELAKHIGKDTLNGLVAAMSIGDKEQKSLGIATGSETVTDATVNDETGEYEAAGYNDKGVLETEYDENSNQMHVKAINEPIYAYYQTNSLTPKKGGFLADTGGMTKDEKIQRKYDNNLRREAGEPPLPESQRPRLFHVDKDGKPTQKSAFTGKYAADETVKWLEESLGLDRSVPNMLRLLKEEKNQKAADYVADLMKLGTPEAQAKIKEIKDAFFVNRAGQYRVGTKSVGEILKKQGNSQASILSMYHAYLNQDATRLRDQASKIERTDPKKFAAMIEQAKALETQGNDAGRVLNDILDTKESVAKRMTPAQHAAAHKAALDYFDSHHVVLAEELNNRDNSKMTPTDFLKLADIGDRAVSHAQGVSGKHISELNILTFESPRLSTHKKDKKVHITAGSLVNWVLQQRGDMYESDVEKDRKSKQFNARSKNIEYLDALMEGLAVLIGSDLVEDMPTMVNAKNEGETFGMKNKELVASAEAKQLIVDNLTKQKDVDPNVLEEAQFIAKVAADRAEYKRHIAPPGLMLDNATVADLEFGDSKKHRSIDAESEGEYGHEFVVGLAKSLSRLTPETMTKGERTQHDKLFDIKETLLAEAEKLKDTVDMNDGDEFFKLIQLQGKAMVAVGEFNEFMRATAGKRSRLEAVKDEVRADMDEAHAKDVAATRKASGDKAVSRLVFASDRHKKEVRAEAEAGTGGKREFSKDVRSAYNELIRNAAHATGMHDGENESVVAEQLKKHEIFVPDPREPVNRGEVRDNNYKRRHMLSSDEQNQYLNIDTKSGRSAFIDKIAKERVTEAMKDGSWKPEGFEEKSEEFQTAREARVFETMLRDWREEFSEIGPFGAMFYEKPNRVMSSKLGAGIGNYTQANKLTQNADRVQTTEDETGQVWQKAEGAKHWTKIKISGIRSDKSGTVESPAPARKATDTPIDVSKGQDKRTAKDEFTAQQEHSEFTGFNAGKTAGVVGGEKKKTALFMAPTYAAATIQALTSNIDEGIQMLRQRLRIAQTPAFHNAKELGITGTQAANMAVGGLHYAVPAAYILTEERITNMEEHGATYEQMMDMAEMRLETARILLAEKGETAMKLGATRMLLGLPGVDRKDKSVTALNFMEKLQGMLDEAKESGLTNADGELYGTKPMNLLGKNVAEKTRAQLDKDSDAALQQYKEQKAEMDNALREGRLPREIKLSALRAVPKQADLSKTPIGVNRITPSNSAAGVRDHKAGIIAARMANGIAEANAVGPKAPFGLGVGRTPKTKPGTNESWSQGAVDKHTAKTNAANGRGTPAPMVMVDNKLVSSEGKGNAKIDYSNPEIANESTFEVVDRMNRAETEWALRHRLELIVQVSKDSDFYNMLRDEINVLKAHRATLPEVAELKVEGKPVSPERQAVRAAAKAGELVAPDTGLLKNPPTAPTAHQAKETAKLIGVDLILAPSTTEGYAGDLGRAAIAEGKIYTPAAYPNMNDKTLLVSVPGKGRGFTGMPAFIDRVMKALESGAFVRTDNKDNAERAWNKDGEGMLREALIAGGYIEMSLPMYSKWWKGAGAVNRAAPRAAQVAQPKAVPAPKVSEKPTDLGRRYEQGDRDKHSSTFYDELPDMNEATKRREIAYKEAKVAELRAAGKKKQDQLRANYAALESKSVAEFEAKHGVKFDMSRLDDTDWSWNDEKNIKNATTVFAMGLHRKRNTMRQFVEQVGDNSLAVIMEHEIAALKESLGESKRNAQVAADPAVAPSTSPGDTATPAARAQALAIAEASAWAGKVLAKDVRLFFKDTLGFSGEWLSVPRIINIAKDAASGILGAMHHEGLHAFFTDFIANEPKNIEVFKSITENAEIKARVHALLDGFPAAQAQLNTPEEVLAYAFQFWKAGVLELPYGKPKTFFQKVQKFFRQVLGKVSDYERATDLLAAFDEGKMVTQDAGKAVIAKIMAQGTWSLKARRAMDKFAQKAAELIVPAEAMLREEVDSAEARAVGLKLFTNPGDETAAGHKEGYVQAHMHAARRAVNPFMWALKGMNPTDHVAIEKYMQAETPLERIPYEPHRVAVEAIRANNDEFHRYMTEDRGLELGYAGKKGYYPVIWNVGKMTEKKDEFIKMLTEKYADELAKIMKLTKLETPEEAAAAVHAAIIFRKGMDEKLNVQREDGVLAPYFANEESRTLNWIEAADREPFLSKDLISTMTSYYNHGAHAAEYAHRFGRKGEGLDLSLKKIGEEMKAASMKRDDDGEFKNEAARVAWLARKMRGIEHAIGAQTGTLGNDVTDRVRKLNSYAMVYQNFRLLATVLFASFADPMGMVANGAPVKHAFDAFMTAMTEVMRSWANMFRTEKKEYRENYYAKLGEMTGAIEHAVISHHVSEEYSSQWLNPLAKKLNDILFKANGMEAFDRGMRAGAMKAAVAFLLHHKALPEQHSERWLQNLGLKPQDIPVNENGQLIVTPKELMLERGMDDTPENQAIARKVIGKLYDSLNRWVEGAIMSPNAAHRPAWGSDPHYAAMFHLKQFTYTWHQTVMKHARQETAHGNMAPLGAIAGIVPITLMSGVMKGLILGGGSMPDNMAGMTFGQHMERAVQSAGVGGVYQLAGHTALHPLSAGGPMVEQVLGGAYDLITGKASVAKVAYDALPLHQLAQGLNPLK